ncbi:MAG: hypothetical protein WBM80_01615 [Woeseiaceae bacterium]
MANISPVDNLEYECLKSGASTGRVTLPTMRMQVNAQKAALSEIADAAVGSFRYAQAHKN